MKRAAILIGLVGAVSAPDRALALATEHFGNKPIGSGWGFGSELLAAVNTDSRVYWYEVNGNPTFFFKGGPKDLNPAIRRFVAIPHDKREIVLLASPGETQSLSRKLVAYDWSLHVPMGLHFDGDSDVADARAVLTIHINAPVPPAPADPAAVRRWIGDLNSDDFKTRERAARELADLGPPVVRHLREALSAARSAEVRDRLEKVLAKVSGAITLDILELPKGVSVVGVEAILERSRKELGNQDPYVRGHAASSLVHRAATTEELLPDLEQFLKTETHEYPLRCAAGAASRLAAAGKPLLPALRAHLESKDGNVRNAVQYAIDAIEKAKPDIPPDAQAKARAALRKEIREFVAEQDKKAK
jgi:hypothetical protein